MESLLEHILDSMLQKKKKKNPYYKPSSTERENLLVGEPGSEGWLSDCGPQLVLVIHTKRAVPGFSVRRRGTAVKW